MDEYFELLMGYPKPENYIWHHHIEAGKFQLVERGIHIANKHDGPFTAGNWAHKPAKVSRR